MLALTEGVSLEHREILHLQQGPHQTPASPWQPRACGLALGWVLSLRSSHWSGSISHLLLGNKLSQRSCSDSTHLLPRRVCGSGIQAQLSWVLYLGLSQGVARPAALSKGLTREGPFLSSRMLVHGTPFPGLMGRGLPEVLAWPPLRGASPYGLASLEGAGGGREEPGGGTSRRGSSGSLTCLQEAAHPTASAISYVSEGSREAVSTRSGVPGAATRIHGDTPGLLSVHTGTTRETDIYTRQHVVTRLPTVSTGTEPTQSSALGAQRPDKPSSDYQDREVTSGTSSGPPHPPGRALLCSHATHFVSARKPFTSDIFSNLTNNGTAAQTLSSVPSPTS